MLTSFTRDEKKILLFLFALIGISSVITTVSDRSSEVPILKGKPLDKAALGADADSTSAVTASTLSLSLGPDGKIDLNLASIESLCSVPGVGRGMAEKIIQHRTQRGPFVAVEDLDHVPGIGPATLAKLRPHFYVAPPSAAVQGSGTTMQVSAPVPTMYPGGTSDGHGMGNKNVQQISMSQSRTERVEGRAANAAGSVARSGVINLNTATLEELVTLHRVGPVLAQRIIHYRQTSGPFRSVRDLEKVKGVGPKIVQDNLHRLGVR